VQLRAITGEIWSPQSPWWWPVWSRNLIDSYGSWHGTVDMDDPFNPDSYGQSDNKVDKVVDGDWYKKQSRNAKS